MYTKRRKVADASSSGWSMRSCVKVTVVGAYTIGCLCLVALVLLTEVDRPHPIAVSYDARLPRGSEWELARQRRLTAGLCEIDFNADEVQIGPVYSLEPSSFTSCYTASTSALLDVNVEIADLSLRMFDGYEVMLVSQWRGGVHNFEVTPEANGATGAHYTIQSTHQPARTFRGHSCLNSRMFCELAFALPIPEGLATLDRHRLQVFGFDWFQTGATSLAEEEVERTETLLASFGVMNLLASGDAPNASLSFPTAIGEYRPYYINGSKQDFMADQESILSYTPHWNNRFFVVTDTGHRRVVVLNATMEGRLEYTLQFGTFGASVNGPKGFEQPWGVAVYLVSWEARYAPVLANIFVADRSANRLVKLNLGYATRESKELQLTYSGEYNDAAAVAQGSRRLNEPISVVCFRHFVVVAEGAGNVVSILMVNYTATHQIEYVTHFSPGQGVQLTGSLAVTQQPYGYVWYTAMRFAADTFIGSFRLPESIRISDHPDVFEDFVQACVNVTWYNTVLRRNAEMYVEHVRWVLDGARINSREPNEDGYVNIWVFNTTAGFDFELFNATVWRSPLALRLPVAQRQFRYCGTPPPPTPPPMSAGNEDGWIINGVPAEHTWIRASAAWTSTQTTKGVLLMISFVTGLVL